MPDFGVDQAKQRVTDALRSGNWQSVDAQVTAYGAAVRAEARWQALQEAIAALQDIAEKDGGSVADCLAAVRRLQ
ncbi:MAG TPA: hypothetical protein VKV26_02065 [Dehalococcoidia bacterium]|nr:hypothetical protein [Dehalococcoidia bacterium]